MATTELLRAVSTVLFKHMRRCRHDKATEASARFHESKYKTEEWTLVYPTLLPTLPLYTLFHTEKRVPRLSMPTVEELFAFIRKLVARARLSAECIVIALVYIERLMFCKNAQLLPTTWRPIVLGCLLVASKMWEDVASWNSEFSAAWTPFSLAAVTRLEGALCETMSWEFHVSGSCYARYYFALRKLLNPVAHAPEAVVMQPAGQNPDAAEELHDEAGGARRRYVRSTLASDAEYHSPTIPRQSLRGRTGSDYDSLLLPPPQNFEVAQSGSQTGTRHRSRDFLLQSASSHDPVERT